MRSNSSMAYKSFTISNCTMLLIVFLVGAAKVIAEGPSVASSSSSSAFLENTTDTDKDSQIEIDDSIIEQDTETAPTCRCPLINIELDLPNQNNPKCKAIAPPQKYSHCGFEDWGRPCKYVEEVIDYGEESDCGGTVTVCDVEINPNPQWCAEQMATITLLLVSPEDCGDEVLNKSDFQKMIDQNKDDLSANVTPEMLADIHCTQKGNSKEVESDPFPCTPQITSSEVKPLDGVVITRVDECKEVVCEPGDDVELACALKSCLHVANCPDGSIEYPDGIEGPSCEVNDVP